MILGVILLTLLGNATGQSAGEPEAGGARAETPASPSFPLTAFASIGSSYVQGSHLSELGWNEAQIAAFVDGVHAALQGKAYAFDNMAQAMGAEMARRLQEIEMRKKQQVVEAFGQPGQLEKYLKEMRKRYSMQQSDSGLLYHIQPGQPGARPRPGDTVVVSCVALAADGTTKLPQLSNDHVRVKLADILPGFMEGLQMMTVDSQAKFVLPPELSFGAHEWPVGVDRGTPLLFFVTLHELIGAEAAP